jgi:peptidoglycan/LPS O-acetylase OafA/YrhL
VTFARLRPADWVVFVAALALLFTTAADWYSTKVGDEARKIEANARPQEGRPSGQTEAEVQRAAGAIAESQERNAWEEDGTIDRVILICLLATAALGVAAGFWRASGREPRGLGPYAPAGLLACVTALLVLYRILQEPGFDELTTVKVGAPLALGVLGVFAFAAATSLRQEGRAVPESPQAG